jgi:hypothetical protein
MYNSPMPESRAETVWKTLAIVGMSLVVVGLGAVSFDFATMRLSLFITDHYPFLLAIFSFITDYFVLFLLAILVGVAQLAVSLIGWAAVLGKSGRKRIALLAVTVPLGVIFIGYALGGTNVHGPFYLFLLPMAPLIVVGIVVAIMAASARRT